jgi:ribosome-binding factor A
MMVTRRQRRVAELIHRELSLLLMLETRDPRLASVTITDVDVTPDLMLARIYFAVLGSAEEEQGALAGFESAKGFLRTQLAGRIQLRLMPELLFYVDKSAQYGQHIDELLDQIAQESDAGDES